MISKLSTIHFEVDTYALRQRFWQILPGLLSWSTLIGLTVLAFVIPYWIAVFVIVFDVYVLVRAVYMSIHLVYAFREIQKRKGIDWLSRCTVARQDRSDAMDWQSVHHAVIIPTYNESLTVLRSTLAALQRVDYPKERMHVVVAFEERSGETATQKAKMLVAEFRHAFGTFLTTMHPDGLPGERAVKSANASWAVQRLEEKLEEKGITVPQVLVSNFDSDTVVRHDYFSYLTYTFITHPDRYRVSYQPIPVYDNNLWDAPSFSRVVAMGSTFWQMIESTRPERMVTFSSHSMSLTALKDVGYWQRDIISEDSRIFWQCLLHYNGKYRTQPLYTTVSMDAALARTWWQTLKNQYKQKRRWAWGIENFPYLAEGFLRNSSIPVSTKLLYLFRTLEGHYSWATVAIIIAVLGWIPIFFGNPTFHATVLSYSLPYITRTLMTIAMSGLVVSAMLTLLLLAKDAHRHSRWRYIGLIFQWALVPIIATLLSAIPALDAETRLMFGRDLDFQVMEKARREDEDADA